MHTAQRHTLAAVIAYVARPAAVAYAFLALPVVLALWELVYLRSYT